jgi:hypothetical protein
VGSKSEKDPVDPQRRSGESDNRSLEAAEAKHSIPDVSLFKRFRISFCHERNTLHPNTELD